MFKKKINKKLLDNLDNNQYDYSQDPSDDTTNDNENDDIDNESYENYESFGSTEEQKIIYADDFKIVSIEDDLESGQTFEYEKQFYSQEEYDYDSNIENENVETEENPVESTKIETIIIQQNEDTIEEQQNSFSMSNENDENTVEESNSDLVYDNQVTNEEVITVESSEENVDNVIVEEQEEVVNTEEVIQPQVQAPVERTVTISFPPVNPKTEVNSETREQSVVEEETIEEIVKPIEEETLEQKVLFNEKELGRTIEKSIENLLKSNSNSDKTKSFSKLDEQTQTLLNKSEVTNNELNLLKSSQNIIIEKINEELEYLKTFSDSMKMSSDSLIKSSMLSLDILEKAEVIDENINNIDLSEINKKIDVTLNNFLKIVDEKFNNITKKLEEVNERVDKFDKEFDKKLLFVVKSFNVENEKSQIKQQKALAKINDDALANINIANSKFEKYTLDMVQKQKEAIRDWTIKSDEIYDKYLNTKIDKFDEYSLTENDIKALKTLLIKTYLIKTEVEDNKYLFESLNYLVNLNLISLNWRDDLGDMPTLAYWVDIKNADRVRAIIGKWEFAKLGKTLSNNNQTN